MSSALAVHQALREEPDVLREELTRFSNSIPTLLLDPKRVCPTRWANRHATAYSETVFDSLNESIVQSGDNVQPVLARETSDGTFEIVFGHRRHRACLELGPPVLATVCTSAMTYAELFVSMDRCVASCCMCCQAASTASATTGCWPTAAARSTWGWRASF